MRTARRTMRCVVDGDEKLKIRMKHNDEGYDMTKTNMDYEQQIRIGWKSRG